MANHYNLFRNNLQGLKRIGGGSQYIALCPFHEDTKASFSFNNDNGLWNCKACGVQGNAYQYAERLGLPEPHKYIEDNGVSYNYIPPPPKKPTISKEDLLSQMERYKTNLKNNLDKYPKYWDESLIDELGIGLNGDDLVFGYYDSESELKGYKVHKKWTKGDATNHWYPSHKIEGYRADYPLYICEGEKDVITLLSQGLQAITTTAGALSIPKNGSGYDIDFNGRFKEVFILYDNDDSGRKGSKKMAEELLKKHPVLNVIVGKWNDNQPKGFDVTDSFEIDGGADFRNALWDSFKVDEKSNIIGGLKLIRGMEAAKIVVIPKKQIIDQILPENAQIILGGTTNANKSFMAMYMGMCLANDEDEFLSFKINVKGLSVLFFDTEIGQGSLVQRFQDIKARNFKNWTAGDRFNMLSKVGNSVNIYDDLEKAIDILKPDVVMIDCLYNTADGSDITKNHKMFPILQRVTEIRDKGGRTVVVIHHCNKGGHEQGLVIERLMGGSALINWAEHIMLLSRTNEDSTRLFRIGKSRHFDYSQSHYLLEWDSDKLKLINCGVTNDWKKYLIQDAKKIRWANVLEKMEEDFATGEFQIAVAESGDASEKTARNWLKEMVKVGVIEKVKYGVYRKKLKVISDVG